MKVQDKVIVVTGAGNGIGRELVQSPVVEGRPRGGGRHRFRVARTDGSAGQPASRPPRESCPQCRRPAGGRDAPRAGHRALRRGRRRHQQCRHIGPARDALAAARYPDSVHAEWSAAVDAVNRHDLVPVAEALTALRR